MKITSRKLLLPLLGVLAISANAREHLLSISLNDLEIISGNLPEGNVNLPHSWQGGRWVPEVMPYAVASQAKEIYLLMNQDDIRPRWRRLCRPGQTRVIIRTDRLLLTVLFSCPKATATACDPLAFV